MSKEQFASWLEEKEITLTSRMEEQFDLYYRLLIEWNKHMNLTGITAEDEVYEKHFFDSLTAAFPIDIIKVEHVIDIGAGAGFPSIPLKICFPHLSVVIVDSLKKRISFLEHLAKELHIDNVTFLHGRAEDIARDSHHRNHYDVALARAVARMPVLTELCLPFVKKNGIFIALKGASGQVEQKEANKACRLLGGRWLEPYVTKLPNEKSNRYILRMEKVDATPKKYPRKAGIPAKKPLL